MGKGCGGYAIFYDYVCRLLLGALSELSFGWGSRPWSDSHMVRTKTCRLGSLVIQVLMKRNLVFYHKNCRAVKCNISGAIVVFADLRGATIFKSRFEMTVTSLLVCDQNLFRGGPRKGERPV